MMFIHTLVHRQQVGNKWKIKPYLICGFSSFFKTQILSLASNWHTISIIRFKMFLVFTMQGVIHRSPVHSFFMEDFGQE